MAENERVPSTHELYLDSLAEARENEGNTAEAESVVESEVPAPYAVEGNDTSAFVGVSPEYRTYSGEFGKPYQAEEGPTVDAEKEAAERRLPLQAPANPVHPSQANVTQVAGDGEQTGVVEEEGEDKEPADSPQLPPVPTASKRGSHRRAEAAESNDSSDDEN